jgi:hypothetical protein
LSTPFDVARSGFNESRFQATASKVADGLASRIGAAANAAGTLEVRAVPALAAASICSAERRDRFVSFIKEGCERPVAKSIRRGLACKARSA